jgi:hypothetical protein
MFVHNDNEVVRMPPLSVKEIEQRAFGFLRRVAPANAAQPRPLDLQTLVDDVLPQFDIHVVPANDDELVDAYAIARAEGEPGDPIEVLIRESAWDDLAQGGPRAYHARGTIAHELGHVALHVPVMRERRRLGFGFQRARKDQVKAYEDPEWQAWAFGTCLLAPRQAILMSGASTIQGLAQHFETSVDLMERHVRRLRLHRRRINP